VKLAYTMIASIRLRILVVSLLLGSHAILAWGVSHPKSRLIDGPIMSRNDLLVGLAWTTTGFFLPPLPPAFAYTPDSDKLRESLYLMSRVQEATVQQERFVRSSSRQQELKQKMKLTLKLVEKNYLLLDQVNFASNFVAQDDIVPAVEAGNEAVESLQAAIDFVNSDLNDPGTLTDDQREYLVSNLTDCRNKLFVFLQYMPQDKLRQARERVEYENVKNREEYAGSADDGLFNPVKLPWNV
jgi:hypothetical protein